jgi:two-component system, sensor histidine kinase LadS
MTMPFSDLPRLLLGLFLLCGAVAPALATPSVVTADAAAHVAVSTLSTPGTLERAVWRDDSGQANWSAARAATYAPIGRMLAGGYTPAAHWLRIQVPASEAPLKLRLRPAFVDQLDVYDELSLVQAAPQARERPIASLGDRQLLSRAAGPSGLSGFVSLAAHDELRHVWVRVASTSTQLVHLEVLGTDQAVDKERAYDLIVGGYLGLLIMFGVWALAQLSLSFDRLIVAYVVKQVADVLYVAGFTGLTNFLLISLGWEGWAHLADVGFSLAVLLVVSTAIWFHSEVIREFEPPRWLMMLFYAGVAMLPLGVVMIALGQARLALQLNTTLAGVLPLILFLAVFTAKAFQDPTKRANLPATRAQLLLVYGLISVSILIAVTPALGAMAGSEAQLHGFLMHGLFTSAIMLAFLMSRARRQDRLQREALARLDEIEREIEVANVRREQQGQFMNMLVHELKTPLSVVKMVLGSGRRTPSLVQSAESAIQSMTGVIERCKQAEMLDSNVMQVQPKSLVRLADMALDLRDRHGLKDRLQMDVPKDALLETDAELLRVILSNLLDNARRYSPSDSTVLLSARLSMHESTAGWKIEVRNQPGVHGQPDPSLVFTKFYRHPKAHHETGSGLGLYLVSQFARMLDGWARYRTETPYLVFTVWIPR